MGHFSDQVHITVDGFTQNIIYYDLNLSQKMADHHHFSFVWQYTGKAVIKPEDQAKAIRSFIGSEVIFTFKSLTGIKLMSKGIINKLTSADLNGSAVNLHVSGISHTIVLDDRPKSRTYLERGMDHIVLDILSEGPTEFYQREAIRSTYMKEFNYIAQYNESNFNFLKRLSARYGQWFYFDGMRMQYGQTKNTKIKLINGASLHSFKIEVNMAAHKISLGGYDYSNAVNIRNSAERTSSGSKDSFALNVGYNQGIVTQPEISLASFTNNAQHKDEIEEMVTLQTAGSDANSVYYSGISYFPLGLGQTFTIINQTIEHHLVCIESNHHSQVHGNYSCEFKAIPADVSAPHYTDTAVFAKAETQPAKIKDNKDPEGLGRVRVDFFWGEGTKSSQWIRMIQPHGGAGKGFYFIPEIGEEVLVGFEGANAQCPYVMGAHYNGQESSGYNTPKNDIKVIQTRSGNRIISDDATGDITIESQKGKTIAVVHGDGNIRFKAPKNIELEAGEDIIMKAGQNITSTAGMNISESAGVDKSTMIGMMHTLSVGGNHMLNVTGNCMEYIEGNLESHTEKGKIFHSNKIELLGEEKIEVNSSKKVKRNSGEKTQDN
ncbi:type VI secretion system Vgr family protein [Flavobacterium reichenbachii]|uniref:Type IV secretion protein Rhs n=1 Tax=Flavobacterium reichenbachii TaxID=362418 RepID=A0A085ZGB9_9FLAO|nr:phage baseplate assembly protein V [Flavobacterium reichenbachii]KFF03483.1 type IV secretion protein Rhs [Flavobacterium reichenbachii]OXB15694.1 type IV secretion protein Rhs [Flavobacterium reichenbachii]